MAITGSLHVLLLDREKDIYGVSFAPYQTRGGALGAKEIHGRDGLKEHLLGLNIHQHIIEKALQDVQRDGRCDIPNVSLNG
ncbi:MAG: hypothetical protein ACHQ7N_17605 [Candidatus Methylomirabilales bacterium]